MMAQIFDVIKKLKKMVGHILRVQHAFSFLILFFIRCLRGELLEKFSFGIEIDQDVAH